MAPNVIPMYCKIPMEYIGAFYWTQEMFWNAVANLKDDCSMFLVQINVIWFLVQEK